jgi:aspartyl aminopeptidase
VSGNGFSIVGAHTDSPNLQLKPVSRVAKGDFLQVGVSTYGGGLWHTWFDRDLTIAGRVLVREGAGVATRLVHVKRPILKIPNLAIHLDRTVSEKFVFNNEDQLVPILSSTFNKPANPEEARDRESKAKHHSALLALIAREIGCEVGAIEDLELSVVDTQPAAIGGIDNDFVFGPRLDNQGMSFCGLEGLVQSMSTLADCSSIRMLGLFDHEEVGSSSTQGAASSLVLDTLRRITNSMAPAGSHSSDLFERTIRRSFLVSADMAHSLHPNYASKHEANHQPKIGGGVVIKTNVNQRYATSTPTGYVIREVAKRNGVPIQEFVVRNDSPCGSTIGPILASLAGIRAVDIGNPMLGMHSIRETCGAGDVEHAIKLISGFYTDFPSIDNNLKVEVDHK